MSRFRGLHPLLLAAYPVLQLYNVNVAELAPTVMLVPLAKVLAATLATWLAIGLMLKDRLRAALIVSLLLALFFSYGHVYLWADSHWPVRVRHRQLLPAWALVAALGVLVILRLRSAPLRLHQVLDVATVVLTATVACGIVLSHLRQAVEMRQSGEATGPSEVETTPKERALPNIYYIVLDSYAGAPALERLYGFDNYPFLRRLEKLGFYVADSSHSNYWCTLPSMASSLNMEYLDGAVDLRIPVAKETATYHRLIRANRVGRELAGVGYSQVFINPPWEMFLGSFEESLWRTTLLTFWQDLEHSRRQTLETFEKIEDARRQPGPVFVYAHVLCPHGPYVFGPHGEPVESMRGVVSDDTETRKRRYLDQLQFVNQRLESLLRVILSGPGVSPIVVLQADHGPTNEGRLSSPSARLIRERFSILNALYVPYSVRANLYPSITPVNTFRAILSYAFGLSYPMLPDESVLGSVRKRIEKVRRIGPREL